ncbi:hypothetical protein Bca52824_006832 [Brassica carinata]|uniref:Uncharacterized protein n=1 Tax=Brassica carinata TaxID=52824 RepID=A0A8X7W571_BRACI|nr:hypothetical protein Bca52824_006832 [Brassica carinata]
MHASELQPSQSSVAVRYRRCDPSSSRGSLSRSSGVVASAEILAVSPPWKFRNRLKLGCISPLLDPPYTQLRLIRRAQLSHVLGRARAPPSSGVAVFSHGGDGFKGLDQPTLSTTVTILPSPEIIRQEIPGGAVGLGDDGGESAIGEERVGGTTNTVWIAVGGLVGEGTPLGGLVDGVRLQDQAALGAERVSGGVIITG